jgi:peptide/nickel transport system permease protein
MLIAVPLIFGVIAFNFILIHLAPGDPTSIFINYKMTPTLREKIIEDFGLNQPLYVQLAKYFADILQGNFGYSFSYNEPVLDVIGRRIPATLLLTGSSLLLSVLIGVPLGVIAARKPFSKTDRFITAISTVSYSMPTFWLSLILLLLFALYLDIFPAGGISSITAGAVNPLDILYHLFLPMVSLTIINLGVFALFTRASLLDVLKQDYIRTARAKGLSEHAVLYRHALRNGLLPIVTVFGLYVAFMVQGAIMVETVFNWPGLGRLTYDAILMRDYPLILGLFLIFSVILVIVNLITDIVYAYIDPRIKFT